MTNPRTSTRHERIDATRNRQAILAAASALFTRPDAAAISMRQVAAVAGVGKGTVFRHFADRETLIAAVLQPRVTALREAIESGPAPLGPGGPPEESLVALVLALFDFAWHNRPLLRALEVQGPDAYYANAASRFWIDELIRRLAATAPGTDHEYRGHVLFTALRADVIEYLMNSRGMDEHRLRAGLTELARAQARSETRAHHVHNA
ncbi:TetR/AcrR family transcriptional regulator [Dactylosporangium vinaceum]|uniref:TetR/AcrR family transcriptional regulator n=1 Tax=Dactylosporangium vinaceum TaxID=53362 RepID=A0ABV5M388_9ACTN|nr:TetR/AcrR family transcriptional regulator [Dactylosporangium vinaceum]UAB99745.1 TetR/AcrR family transcriptional regulator [Dactylosporangium vinaceum]